MGVFLGQHVVPLFFVYSFASEILNIYILYIYKLYINFIYVYTHTHTHTQSESALDTKIIPEILKAQITKGRKTIKALSAFISHFS